MEEPKQPSWNCKSTKWDPPLSGHDDVQYPLLSPVWKSMWHWLCGNKHTGSCCVVLRLRELCFVVLCCLCCDMLRCDVCCVVFCSVVVLCCVLLVCESGVLIVILVIDKKKISSKELADLKPELYSKGENKEAQRLHGAYTLGLIGDIPTLKEAIFKGKEECITRNASHGLLGAGGAALPFLLSQIKVKQMSDIVRANLIFALGELGRSGWPAVGDICYYLSIKERSTGLRHAASETLGMILAGCCACEKSTGEPASDGGVRGGGGFDEELLREEREAERRSLFEKGVRTLCHIISEDADDQLRFQCCLSLVRLVAHLQHTNDPSNKNEEKKTEKEEDEKDEWDNDEDEADDESEEEEPDEEDEEEKEDNDSEGLPSLEEIVLTALGLALRDSNRYVRGYAIEGLKRLAPSSPKAQQLLLRVLLASYHCPLTTPEEPF